MKVKIVINGELQNKLLTYSQGDYGQKIKFKVFNDDDTVFDLTGYTIEFRIKLLNDYDEYLVIGNCDIDNASKGLCSYELQKNDLDQFGVFETYLTVSTVDDSHTVYLGFLNVDENPAYVSSGTVIADTTTSDDLAEGSTNLFYSDERAQDAVGGILTDNSEITWTYDDVNNEIEANFLLSSKSTTDLPEGSNLYYTDERVDDRVANLIQDGMGITWTYDDVNNTLTGNVTANAINDTDDVPEGTNNLYFTEERVDDRVANFIQDGTGITWSYDDVNNTFTPTVTASSIDDSDDVPEGNTNLYFTNERAQDSVGGILSNTASIDFTYDDAGNSISASVNDSAIDHTNLQNIGSNSHAQIDTHIASTSNPHNVTLEQSRSQSNIVSGNIDLGGNLIIDSGSPTNGSDLANKDYVDSIVQGLNWNDPVLDEIDFTTNEPASPNIGDRYINTVTGTSSVTAQSMTENYIYEWNGSSWDEYIVSEGDAVWVEDIDVTKVYNGSNWVQFGSTITHNNTSGLQGGTSGEYFHLSQANYTDLTDGGDSTLHFHSSDRNRSNHTGTQTASTISNFDEAVDDRVNTLVQDGTGITWTYNDVGNTLTGNVTLSPFDTSDLSEGSNLYYTDERAQDSVGTILTDSSEIDFTYDDATPQITASLVSGSIDETKLDTSVNNSLDLADSSVQPGDNISTLTNDAGYITATLTEEEVQDFAWNVLTGTQTLITVTYDDANNNVDFIVNNDLSQYDNTTSAFITASSTDTLTNKTIDADGTGNSITNIDNDEIKSAAAIDATKIHDGSVTNTEFGYIGGLTSDAQTQLNAKLENISEDTTPQLGGNLDLNDNAITEELTAGELLASGDICYLNTDGKYWKADATSSATSSTDIVIATEAISADTTGTFLIYGNFTTSGLTAGNIQYISETAGAYTSTAPSTSGSIVRILGYAKSSTVFVFKPDITYVEVA